MIHWPPITGAGAVSPAVIPEATQCISVKLSNAANWTAEGVSTRPSGATQSTITILDVPSGEVHVHAGAYDAFVLGAGGAITPSGNLLAWTTHDVTVPANDAVEIGFSLSTDPARIEVSAGGASTDLMVGDDLPLTATGFDGDDNLLFIPTFTWTSSTPAVATVDEAGKVHAVAPGAATMRASVGAVYGELPVTVRALPTVTLTADPTSVIAGGSTTLKWTSTNADTVVSSDFAADGVAGEATVTPAATTTYTITVSGPGGQSTATATVTVIAVTSVQLVADPPTITVGQTTTLRWTSTNADTVDASDFGATTVAGELAVQPNTTTTYSITVSGPGGQATDSATVTVTPLPAVSIIADDLTIIEGQSTVLRWTSVNADTVDSSSFGATTVTGQQTISPAATTTYTITVSGPGGQAMDRMTVTVIPPTTVTLTADDTSIIEGQSTTLRWTSTNADTVVSSNFGAATVTGQGSVSPKATTTYTITVGGPGGQATDTVIVTVIPATTVNLTADPASIPEGGRTLLSWTSTNATSVVSSDFGANTVNGQLLVSPVTTHTYTITMSGPGGQATDTATVTVIPHPTVTLTATPSTIYGAGSSTLQWASTDATTVVSTVGFTANDVNGQVTVSPTSTETYEITVSGPGGQATATATVTVLPPTQVTLTASLTSIKRGESTTLQWTSTSATGVDSSTFGANDVNGQLVITPDKTVTHSITVAGPTGPSTSSVTITVTGQAIVG